MGHAHRLIAGQRTTTAIGRHGELGRHIGGVRPVAQTSRSGAAGSRMSPPVPRQATPLSTRADNDRGGDGVRHQPWQRSCGRRPHHLYIELQRTERYADGADRGGCAGLAAKRPKGISGCGSQLVGWSARTGTRDDVPSGWGRSVGLAGACLPRCHVRAAWLRAQIVMISARFPPRFFE